MAWIKTQIRILEKNSNIGVVSSDAVLIDENDCVIGMQSQKNREMSYVIKGLTLIVKMHPIIHPSTVIRGDLRRFNYVKIFISTCTISGIKSSNQYHNNLNNETFYYSIEYWIEDLFGNIIKSKYHLMK